MLLVAPYNLAAQQSANTTTTLKALSQIMGYCHSHPPTCIQYKVSDMTLHIGYNVSYLSLPKACS